MKSAMLRQDTFLAVNKPRYAVSLASSSVSSTVRTGWPVDFDVARKNRNIK